MQEIFKQALKPFAPRDSSVHLTDTDSRSAEKVTRAEEYAEPGDEAMFPIIGHISKEEQRIARADASLAKQLQNSMERNSRLTKRIATLEAALEDCLEYFKDQYDVVDGSYGEPAPNKEMQLGQMITEALYGPGVV